MYLNTYKIYRNNKKKGKKRMYCQKTVSVGLENHLEKGNAQVMYIISALASFNNNKKLYFMFMEKNS